MPYPALPLAEAHRHTDRAGLAVRDHRGSRSTASARGSGRTRRRRLREVFLLGRGFGDKTFLVYEDERATFEAFARAAVVFAQELQSFGVAKGDRVAIAMRNLPEWPVAFFGTILAGAIAVPLNAWSTGPELEYVLARFRRAPRRARRRALRPAARRISTRCPALRVVLVSRARTRSTIRERKAGRS